MSGDVAVEVSPERENEWGFAGADKWAEKLQKLSFLSFGKLPSLGRQMDKNRGQSVRFRKEFLPQFRVASEKLSTLCLEVKEKAKLLPDKGTM